MILIRISALLLASALLTIGYAQLSSGHEHATGIVGERMAAMRTMGRELKAIVDMIAGSTPFDPGLADKHATALHDACHKIDLLFPAGSLDHVSHAKPAIWNDPEAFAAEVSRLHNASNALLKAAKSQE
jgi:cytochrome c556